MWGELRKLRSNAAIRISLLHYMETDLQNCESCEAMQQFVYHYILQGNRFAELRKLRSNAAIRISLYTTGKQICRIAKVAKQRSNEAIRISLLHREGLYEHYKA